MLDVERFSRPAMREQGVSFTSTSDSEIIAALLSTHLGVSCALVRLSDAAIRPVDPNKGMDAVRLIAREHAEGKIKGVSFFPSGQNPPVPINSKLAYPIYAKCCELNIPVFCTTGVPGPRIPLGPQKIELIDEVCYDFPELKFVMRHGAEPWVDLAVKLLLKWPNLYYSTSAFAPRYWPREIIDFANTRGSDKIIYAGYFPMGLTLDRIFTEMDAVPFKDEVWPKFLRDNAMKVLKLDA